MPDDVVSRIRGIDFIMSGLDPNRVHTRVFADETGDIWVEVMLEARTLQYDTVAICNRNVVEVVMGDSSTDAHAALATRIIALYSDRFEVLRRDGDWALLDLAAQADVRTLFDTEDWSARTALRTAVIADDELVSYNDGHLALADTAHVELVQAMPSTVASSL